jgi:hypothetical protein
MPTVVRPADRYAPTTDLGVVTAYFNPAGFRSRRRNYDLFRDRIQAAGIPLVTVEYALGNRPFELPPGIGVHRVRGRDIMWQKERLLNVAIAGLPDTCRKVAWLDADVLFENPDWAVTAAARLDEFPVVQLLDRAVRLRREVSADDGHGDTYPGFAAVYTRQPQRLLAGDFAAPGHTGFAWAARREVLASRGLYDACIAGSGDHMMAHAFAGTGRPFAWSGSSAWRTVTVATSPTGVGPSTRSCGRGSGSSPGRCSTFGTAKSATGGSWTATGSWRGSGSTRRQTSGSGRTGAGSGRAGSLTYTAGRPTTSASGGRTVTTRGGDTMGVFDWLAGLFDGKPAETPGDVADRLERVADRFGNAGDDAAAAAARAAADEARRAPTVDAARRVEAEFLHSRGLRSDGRPLKPALGRAPGDAPYVRYGTTLRTGGSRAWRYNNPGYVRCNNRSTDYGALSCDGEFAIFPDYWTDVTALRLSLCEDYPNHTVREALRLHLPPEAGADPDRAGAGCGRDDRASDSPGTSVSFLLTRVLNDAIDLELFGR